MLAAFDPRYTPMDRKSLATNYIPRLYDKKGNEFVVSCVVLI